MRNSQDYKQQCGHKNSRTIARYVCATKFYGKLKRKDESQTVLNTQIENIYSTFLHWYSNTKQLFPRNGSK